MSHLKRRFPAGRLSSLCAFGAALLSLIPSASAAAATPTPESATYCGGGLTHDPSGASSGEPNLLDYQFQCDTGISAYTVVVLRQPGNTSTIDDFSPTATVLAPDDVTVSSSVSFTCAGTIPGDGINCNAGAGGVTAPFDFVSGSFDPIDPYCKNIAKGAKPGTLAEPQAQVEVVVTDSTGAEDGPFELDLTPACKAVPNYVPFPKPKPKAKPKPKPKPKAKAKAKGKQAPKAKHNEAGKK